MVRRRYIARADCSTVIPVARARLRASKGEGRKQGEEERGVGYRSETGNAPLPGRLFDVGCLLYGRGMIVTASGCTEGPVTS